MNDGMTARESLDFVTEYVDNLKDQLTVNLSAPDPYDVYGSNAGFIRKWNDVIDHLHWHYLNLEGK